MNCVSQLPFAERNNFERYGLLTDSLDLRQKDDQTWKSRRLGFGGSFRGGRDETLNQLKGNGCGGRGGKAGLWCFDWLIQNRRSRYRLQSPDQPNYNEVD